MSATALSYRFRKSTNLFLQGLPLIDGLLQFHEQLVDDPCQCDPIWIDHSPLGWGAPASPRLPGRWRPLRRSQEHSARGQGAGGVRIGGRRDGVGIGRIGLDHRQGDVVLGLRQQGLDALNCIGHLDFRTGVDWAGP